MTFPPTLEVMYGAATVIAASASAAVAIDCGNYEDVRVLVCGTKTAATDTLTVDLLCQTAATGVTGVALATAATFTAWAAANDYSQLRKVPRDLIVGGFLKARVVVTGGTPSSRCQVLLLGWKKYTR